MKTKEVKIEGLSLKVESSLFKDKELQKELKILESRVKELEKALKRVGIIVY